MKNKHNLFILSKTKYFFLNVCVYVLQYNDNNIFIDNFKSIH